MRETEDEKQKRLQQEERDRLVMEQMGLAEKQVRGGGLQRNRYADWLCFGFGAKTTATPITLGASAMVDIFCDRHSGAATGRWRSAAASGRAEG